MQAEGEYRRTRAKRRRRSYRSGSTGHYPPAKLPQLACIRVGLTELGPETCCEPQTKTLTPAHLKGASNEPVRGAAMTSGPQLTNSLLRHA